MYFIKIKVSNSCIINIQYFTRMRIFILHSKAFDCKWLRLKIINNSFLKIKRNSCKMEKFILPKSISTTFKLTHYGLTERVIDRRIERDR